MTALHRKDWLSRYCRRSRLGAVVCHGGSRVPHLQYAVRHIHDCLTRRLVSRPRCVPSTRRQREVYCFCCLGACYELLPAMYTSGAHILDIEATAEFNNNMGSRPPPSIITTKVRRSNHRQTVQYPEFHISTLLDAGTTTDRLL